MTAQRWAILLMDGSPQPAVHQAWYLEGTEEEAERFRDFVDGEIDPAIKVRLHDPLGEALAWRASVALPVMEQGRPA